MAVSERIAIRETSPMGFQIVEIEMEGAAVKARKVAPFPFSTRNEAKRQVEIIIGKYASSGY
jgi:hypothetical protein